MPAYKRANFSFPSLQHSVKIANAILLLQKKDSNPAVFQVDDHLLNHARTNQNLIHHRPTTFARAKKTYLHFMNANKVCPQVQI